MTGTRATPGIPAQGAIAARGIPADGETQMPVIPAQAGIQLFGYFRAADQASHGGDAHCEGNY